MTAEEMASRVADERDAGLRAILQAARAAGRPYDCAIVMAGTNDFGRFRGGDVDAAADQISENVFALHAMALRLSGIKEDDARSPSPQHCRGRSSPERSVAPAGARRERDDNLRRRPRLGVPEPDAILPRAGRGRERAAAAPM